MGSEMCIRDRNTANNFVVFSASDKRFVSSISEWEVVGTPETTYPVYFAPNSVSNMSVSGVTLRATEVGSSTQEFFHTNLFWSLQTPQDDQIIDTFQSGAGSDARTESLFVAKPGTSNSSHAVLFRATGLTQSSQDQFGSLDNIVIPYSDSNGIDYVTGWGAAANILDALYDESNNKFLSLIHI